MTEDTTDRVFATQQSNIEPFEFNSAVASVFDDMIERSVPGYRSIVLQTGLIAAKFATKDSICYDLGCSLGATTFAMCDALQDHRRNDNISIISIDNSEPMLLRMDERLAALQSTVPVNTVLADITEIAFEPHSVAVFNFTLQFIPVSQRAPVLSSIAKNMIPGGALVLSEKLFFEDQQQQRLLTDMYENFKRANGYSELEISQKRDALENVLITESLQTHKKRLLDCGFKSVEVWFQCFNFASLVAIR